VALGTLAAGVFFSKNKGKIIGISIVVLVVGVIYGGMKWDAWRIERLKENLKTEQDANKANTESLQQSERTRGIDEETLTRLLDEKFDIQSSADETVNKVTEDVRRMQREAQEKLERRLASLDKKLDGMDDGEPRSQPILPRPPESKEQPKIVSDRIAGTMADGMWLAYCDAVPDDSVCPQRQPSEEGASGEAPE
jgi:hypothetical protein